MDHFRQDLELEAAPSAVYAALTTPKGLRGWWTPDCDVETRVGATLRFRFGNRIRKAMRVERLEPNREVRWLCTEAHIVAAGVEHPDEWVGTQIVFRLTPLGTDRTHLSFEHIGLVPSLECYGLCDDGWRYFLNSLHQFVETGRGMPFEARPVGAH